MPLWRGGPNTRTPPTVLLTPSASKAADMAHLCVPQNQALGVCRGFVPDIQICGTHGRKDLVNATIISKEEEEELVEGPRRKKKWLEGWGGGGRGSGRRLEITGGGATWQKEVVGGWGGGGRGSGRRLEITGGGATSQKEVVGGVGRGWKR